jgi:hypothetical protein
MVMEEGNNMGKTHDDVFVGILTSNANGDGNNFYQQSSTTRLFNFLFPSTKFNVEPLGEHIMSIFLATSKIIGVKQGRGEQKLSTFKHYATNEWSGQKYLESNS